MERADIMTKTPTGKSVRLAQPVKQVTVDAGLMPKKPGRQQRQPSGEAEPATVNIFAPVHPAVAATRQKMQQQAVRTAAARLGAAIQAGALPAAEAKRLVLSRMVRSLGSAEAAEKWYRSHRLSELGGRTPAQMVRAGELKTLLEHLARDSSAKA